MAMNAIQASPALRVENRDGVMWLTKTNPESHYGISVAMLDALGAAIAAAEDDPSIRAVVVDADGKGFHNGAVMVTELKPRLTELTRSDFRNLVQRGHTLGRSIANLTIPVIGIARGGALGGGLELLLRSDFLYCTDAARFSFPEVTLGFVAAWGGTQWAGRLMPFRKAQEFLLLGETIDGHRAEELGLVTRSFADVKALDAHVEDLVNRLRLCSPASFRWTKACLAATWDGPVAHGETVEVKAEIETMATGDFVHAVAAFAKGCYFNFVTKKTVPGR